MTAARHNLIDWTELRQRLLLDDGKLVLPAGWKLPIIPKSVSQFLHLANQPDYNLRSLSKILEQDSHLTCELLKHVNSAAMGLRHKSKTAHQALVNLGIRRSKMVLLTAAIQSTVKQFNGHLFDLHQFWAENLERALFAREVAGEIGADLDLAFTAAILQDFLIPVLSQYNVQTYVAYWGDRKGVPCDLIDYEIKKFGVQHAQVAAACMMQWNIPDELVCAVLCHHMNYQQLEELGLLGSHVYAVALSSLLPSAAPQYQQGAVKLAEWDLLDPSFDLCDIAERVDACYLHHDDGQASDREPLASRLEYCLTSHFQTHLSSESLINRHIGNFLLESCIGSGAMGTVYQAKHLLLNRKAAVKILHKEELSSLDIARFEREVQLCSQLTHPHTISIYDYGRTHDGLFYYVMELIEGMTLKQLIHLFGRLPESRVIFILRQICQSLQEAHELGIIHRDIKPENIIVSQRGSQADFVTVLDFGLVRDMRAEVPESEQGVSGTPLYMSPESIQHPASSCPANDIYAIGAVGYYLLTGQSLYTGNDALDICLKQLSELPPRPSQRVKQGFSDDLEDLIMSCLQKSIELRPASAGLLDEKLGGCRAAVNWSGSAAHIWWQKNVGTATLNHQSATKLQQDATVIGLSNSTC